MTDQRPAIIEIRRYGQAVKVTAADSVSLIEVSLQAPASTPESTLRQLVLAKLARAIERDAVAGRPKH
ncbi:MAG TPA: hypothetical protein VKZ79_18965 [Alphaproteobacteria bacterium]|nr:hypothetical protein [Alphaproteobacteria bacterium]